MALDASILQGYRPIQYQPQSEIENYRNALAIEGGMNQNALAKYQLSKVQREDARAVAGENALRGADFSTPDGRTRALNALAPVDPRMAMEYRGKFLEQDTKEATLAETRAKNAKSYADQAARAIAGAKTPAELDAAFSFWEKNSPEQARIVRGQAFQALESGKPVTEIAPRVAAMFSEDVLKQLQAFAPKAEYKDIGGSVVPVNTNSLAGPVGPMAGVNALTKTNTPDALMTDKRAREEGALNRGVTVRGQDMTDRRAADALAAGKAPTGYRFKADNTLEAIPGGPADGLTTTQKDDLTSIARTQLSATRLKDMFKPEFVGFKGTMGEFWDKYGSQALPGAEGNTERIQFRALAADLENQYIKAISGATVPTSEVPRLRRAIPTPSDSPAQYKAKLDEMETNLASLPETIRNGAKPGAPKKPAEVAKVLNGKKYVKRNGEWYEESN